MNLDLLRIIAIDCNSSITLFGIPNWYDGLTRVADASGESCSIEGISLGSVWVIVANVTRMALALAALLAIGFIIVGGITYITSRGNPEQTKRAQDILANSVLGLVLAIFASAIVGFVARSLT